VSPRSGICVAIGCFCSYTLTKQPAGNRRQLAYAYGETAHCRRSRDDIGAVAALQHDAATKRKFLRKVRSAIFCDFTQRRLVVY